jgi:hypothetical protein
MEVDLVTHCHVVIFRLIIIIIKALQEQSILKTFPHIETCPTTSLQLKESAESILSDFFNQARGSGGAKLEEVISSYVYIYIYICTVYVHIYTYIHYYHHHHHHHYHHNYHHHHHHHHYYHQVIEDVFKYVEELYKADSRSKNHIARAINGKSETDGPFALACALIFDVYGHSDISTNVHTEVSQFLSAGRFIYLYVYIYTYIDIHVYIFMIYLCIYIYLFDVYGHPYISTNADTEVLQFLSKGKLLYTYLYVYIYRYSCIYIYLYICIYVYLFSVY